MAYTHRKRPQNKPKMNSNYASRIITFVLIGLSIFPFLIINKRLKEKQPTVKVLSDKSAKRYGPYIKNLKASVTKTSSKTPTPTKISSVTPTIPRFNSVTSTSIPTATSIPPTSAPNTEPTSVPPTSTPQPTEPQPTETPTPTPSEGITDISPTSSPLESPPPSPSSTVTPEISP